MPLIPGLVYVMGPVPGQGRCPRIFKIGYTWRLANRRAYARNQYALITGRPRFGRGSIFINELVTFRTSSLDEAIALESDLHNRYAAKQVVIAGAWEWFRLSVRDIHDLVKLNRIQHAEAGPAGSTRAIKA